MIRIADRARRIRIATRLASGVLFSLGAPLVANAHEIHTTHTAITADATGYTLTVRAFADDLSASVAKFRGLTAPKDSSVVVSDLLAYASARLAVTDIRGTPLPMTSCGLKRAQEVYLVCLRIAAPVAATTLRVSNQMLAELHADQVNIVQCEMAGTRRTNLFTRGRAPASIAARGRCAAS